jgi:hypothetical protein
MPPYNLASWSNSLEWSFTQATSDFRKDYRKFFMSLMIYSWYISLKIIDSSLDISTYFDIKAWTQAWFHQAFHQGLRPFHRLSFRHISSKSCKDISQQPGRGCVFLNGSRGNVKKTCIANEHLLQIDVWWCIYIYTIDIWIWNDAMSDHGHGLLGHRRRGQHKKWSPGVRHWVNLKQRYHEVENCYIYIIYTYIYIYIHMAMINGYLFKSSRIHNYISSLRVCGPPNHWLQPLHPAATAMKRLLISQRHLHRSARRI